MTLCLESSRREISCELNEMRAFLTLVSKLQSTEENTAVSNCQILRHLSNPAQPPKKMYSLGLYPVQPLSEAV